MASAFASGFRLGGDMYNQAERNRLLQAREDREAKESEQRLTEAGLRTDALRRAASREADQDRVLGEMRDFATGLQRPQTNATLDADFEAADQANLQGLQMPAVRGGSNMANEAALAVRTPVDINSPEYRAGMAGLRQRYALARGDMADFDKVTAEERTRITSRDDADFVLALQKDPTGPIAVQARSFINKNSPSLSTKVDPKTGITTFAITKGDGFSTVDVSPSDLGKIAVGYRRLERGDVGGLDVIAGVNKDLAAAVRDDMKLQIQGITGNNDAVAKTQKILSDRDTAAATRSYYQARAAAEKMGTAQYFNGDDGNTYAVVPKMGRDGTITLETQQVNTAGVKFKKPGAEGNSKPVDIKDAGTRVLIDGKPYQSDGAGGFIDLKGILPDDRAGFLKKAGVPDNLIGELPWGRDGTTVGYRGRAYNVNDKTDMKALVDDYKKYSANDRAVEEDLARDPHAFPNRQNPLAFGPKVTYPRPDPDAPSIYAGPEAWAAYRQRQAQRQQALGIQR